MAKRSEKNPLKIVLMDKLKSKYRDEEARVWLAIARMLERDRVVNVSKIAGLCTKGETCAVPGKVLGKGDIDFGVSVAAFNFSEKAREKIMGGGGECLSFEELMIKNPKGSGVKILGG